MVKILVREGSGNVISSIACRRRLRSATSLARGVDISTGERTFRVLLFGMFHVKRGPSDAFEHRESGDDLGRLRVISL